MVAVPMYGQPFRIRCWAAMRGMTWRNGGSPHVWPAISHTMLGCYAGDNLAKWWQSPWMAPVIMIRPLACSRDHSTLLMTSRSPSRLLRYVFGSRGSFDAAHDCARALPADTMRFNHTWGQPAISHTMLGCYAGDDLAKWWQSPCMASHFA